MTELGTEQVMGAISEWSLSHGIDNIKDRQTAGEAYFMGKVDEQWSVYINASDEPAETAGGVDVPKWTMYIEFNGWPAGFVNAGGGTIAAGEGANINTFIAALEANLG